MKESRHSEKTFKKAVTEFLGDTDLRHTKHQFTTYVTFLLIILSVVVLVMETHVELSKRFGSALVIIDAALMIIFSVEYALRVWIASDGFGNTKGWHASLKYMRSLYGIIDLLAIFPFYLHLVAPMVNAGFMRVFRLLRVMLLGRYFQSFSLIRRAVLDKKGEIVVALQLVAVLTLILSVLMFELEHPAQPKVFTDIPTTLAWSVSKFIKDVAGYGKADPITPLGQVVATMIGLLSVALFALPAGIVASGFIHEVAEDKHQKDLDKKQNQLMSAFRDVANEWLDRAAPRKFITLAQATGRLGLLENEIVEIAARHSGVRLRYAAQHSGEQYPTALVIENFEKNREYGTCIVKTSKPVTVVCPTSYDELSVGHFARCLALLLDATLISNELFGTPDAIDPSAACSFVNSPIFQCHAESGVPPQYPSELHAEQIKALEQFHADMLGNIGAGSLVLLVRADAMVRTQEHGAKSHGSPKGHHNGTVPKNHFSYANADAVEREISNANLGGVIDTQPSPGTAGQWELHPYLANKTHACVISLWIRSEFLNFAPLNQYYHVIKRLAEAIDRVGGWKATVVTSRIPQAPDGINA